MWMRKSRRNLWGDEATHNDTLYFLPVIHMLSDDRVPNVAMPASDLI